MGYIPNPNPNWNGYFFRTLIWLQKTSFISILYPDYNYKLKMYLKPHNTPPTTITFRFVHFWMCFFIYSFFKAKTTDKNFNRKKKEFIYPPFAETFQKTGKKPWKKTPKAAPSFMEIQDFPQSSVFRQWKKKTPFFLLLKKKWKKPRNEKENVSIWKKKKSPPPITTMCPP